MKKLSEQLDALASRTAKLEDSVRSAQDKDRQRLEAQKRDLVSTMTETRAQAGHDLEAAGDAVSSWWTSNRDSADQWFSGVRAKRVQHRAEHDAAQAERAAEDAELEAADAVDFALYAIDTAEYALIDAALARDDADALRAGEQR